MTDQALAKYDLTIEAINTAVAEYMTLKVYPEDQESYDIAKKARMDLVHKRTAVDKRRKELGSDLRKELELINKAGNTLISLMAPAEEHLTNELKAEDDRIEAIKQAKIKAEEERVQKIRDAIEAIKIRVIDTAGIPASQIKQIIDEVEETVIDEFYEEFTDEAAQAKEETLSYLNRAYESHLKQEQEAEANKIEAERLAKIKAAQEAKEAEIRAEQERREAALAEEQRKIAEAQAEERRKLEEEKAKIAAEKQALEDMKKKEREAKEKAEEEAKEAERQAKLAEERKARAELLKPDKDKAVDYLNALEELKTPVVQSEDVKAFLDQFKLKLDSLIGASYGRLNDL